MPISRITVKSLAARRSCSFGPPDRYEGVAIGDEMAWRSTEERGWSRDEDIKLLAEGADSCPVTHREYVVAGRIRYRLDDGTEVIAEPGDFLLIEPGHRARTEGDEACVLID